MTYVFPFFGQSARLLLQKKSTITIYTKMKCFILKGKLHRVSVTGNDLNYEGSCAIDTELLAAAGIFPYEKVEVYNINTGERFETYAIKAEASSGIVALNGAAARKAVIGDLLIICSYALVDNENAKAHSPKVVMVDSSNKIIDKQV